MTQCDSDTLEQAINRRLPLKLSADRGGGRCVDARLMNRSKDPAGFWVQLLKPDAALVAGLLSAAGGVEAWFGLGGEKIVFDTAVLRRDARHWIGDLLIDGLLLSWPAALEVSRQRRAERFMVTSRNGVLAELFRTRGGTGTPGVYKDAAKLTAELWDLSSGGASFVCPFDKSLLTIPDDEPLLVHLNYWGTRVVMEARRSYVRTLSGAVRIGVRFAAGPAENPGSAEALQRIVRELEGRINNHVFAATRAAKSA